MPDRIGFDAAPAGLHESVRHFDSAKIDYPEVKRSARLSQAMRVRSIER